MDVVEIRTCSLKWINRSFNIHLSSLFDYLNGKTRARMMGPRRVVIDVKDPIVIHVWTVVMQKCKLYINVKFG